MASTDCPFCSSSQAYRYILQTEAIFAMYPKDPACAFHVLIIPRRHVQHLDELSSPEASQLFAVLQRLTNEARDRLAGSFIGYNILSNNGDERVNQRVPHAHLHVFLRQTSDSGNPLIGKHRDRPSDLTDQDLAHMRQLQSWFAS